MNYTDIIKLLEAGYSREEILEMKDAPADDKQEDPTADDKQEDPTAQIDTESIMKEVKDMFAEMRKELTAMNILNSRQTAEEKTADDILANIINPTKKNDSGGK